MQFPTWADGPTLTDKQRASLRLRYLMSTLAIVATHRCSHRALADFVGVNHSTISAAIRNGGFSPYTARVIEKQAGRENIRAEWLVDPLSIKTK